MDESNDDQGWLEDPTRNETRYARILATTTIPAWGLLKESLKESLKQDTKLLFPRMICRSFATVVGIPRAILMSPGTRRDAIVYRTLKTWAARMCELARMRLELRSETVLDPKGTYLFAANHMSPADIPTIYRSLPVNAAFVANALFERVPVFSYWMRKSGAVFVEQGNASSEMKAFKLMIRRLKRGRSLILFPEGYIHQSEGMAGFKRGGLNAAHFAGVPIVPVCIFGTQDVMRSGSLHVVPNRRVCFEIGEPIETVSLSRNSRKNLESIVFNRIQEMKLRYAAEWSFNRPR